MKLFKPFLKSAFLGLVLTIIGCAGTPGSESQIGISQHSATTDPARRSLTVPLNQHTVHPDTRKSWMKFVSKNDRLLYVSDVATDDVDVYEYKSGSLVGQLTGFNEPQGICTDNAGDVYIANTLDSNVLEYLHGATVPIQTLNDSGQLPVDCTVLNDGVVAAANIATSSGGPGSVSYPGYPETVTSPWLSKVFSVGYLGAGARYLFMTVTMNNGEARYAKAWDTTLHRLKTPVKSPGSVRFSGIRKYMAVGDQSGTVYLVHGTAVSTKIDLSGLCAMGQFSITRGYIAVPDPCGAKVSIYAFPQGGSATRTITTDLVQPVGTAISPNALRGP
jgi:hypothetical protein